MNLLQKISSATTTLALISSSAQAVQFSQLLNYGTNVPDFTETLTFDKFDFDAADVNWIKVVLSNDISGGQAAVDNDGVNPATVNISFGAETSMLSTDVTLLNTSFQPVVADVSTVTEQSGISLAGNDSDVDGVFTNDGGPDNFELIGGNINNSDEGFIDSQFFSGFLGSTGTFDIDVESTIAFNISGASGVAGAFAPVNSGGYVEIIIDVDPDAVVVPEPSTYAAILGGLGLLITYVRRRRS